LRSTERGQQPIKFGIVGALEPDSEVRPLAGGQQLELALRQSARCRQVDGTEAGEPAA
jgi:hypothetical protein